MFSVLSFLFQTKSSEVTKQNSSKLCHMFRSEPGLERDIQTLGCNYVLNDVFVVQVTLMCTLVGSSRIRLRQLTPMFFMLTSTLCLQLQTVSGLTSMTVWEWRSGRIRLNMTTIRPLNFNVMPWAWMYRYRVKHNAQWPLVWETWKCWGIWQLRNREMRGNWAKVGVMLGSVKKNSHQEKLFIAKFTKIGAMPVFSSTMRACFLCC